MTTATIDLTEARKKYREQGKLLRQAEEAAGIRPADRSRDIKAQWARKQSREVAEIGMPPPRSERLYKRYRNNLFLFLSENFPQSLGLSPLSEEHKRMIDRLQQTILEGGQELIIAPRGFVKSTIIECTAIWAAGYGHRNFFVPLAATDEMARLALDSIQYEFETNDRLMKIFPAACHAARSLEGVPQRAMKQSIGGELTRIEWTGDRIVLPTVKGFAGSGAIIWPRSIVSKGLRGTRFKRPDGKQARPDFILADDLQTDESAESASQTSKRLAILNKTVLRLGSHRQKLAIVIVGTIIQPDDLLDQLADHRRHPAWRAMKIPMLKSFSNAHDEWLGKYAELRTNHNPDDDADRARAEQEANEYYRANRERLDAGATATWESCFVQEHELSAIQHAYNILIDSGEQAFAAECQNAPLRDTGGFEMLPPASICERQSPFPRGVIPPTATTLTSFIDCHPEIFYIEVWAHESDGTGYCVDAFTFPDQKRKYFAHRKITKRLSELFPGLDAESTLAAGLTALIDGAKGKPGLMQREYRTAEGSPHRIRCCLVDANGEFRDRIVRVLSHSPHSANLHPSYGKGVGAKAAPISAWQQARKQRHAGEWVFTQGRAGEILGIVFDTNFYKTRFHRGLMLPKGSQGALYLWKGSETEHKLAADHYHAEKPDEVTVGGRTVFEFSLKPNADNHRLDCAVGNLVAASRCGVGVPAPATQQRPKRRRTTYYAA